MTAGFVDAAIDPALPRLADALDPACAARAIAASRRFAGARVDVTSARLLRHKVGRRALVDYLLDVQWPDGRRESLAALGKMRAGHLPGAAARRLKAFWRGGFSATSEDGISVPEPLGTVPSLDLWLQRKVPGVSATAVLTTETGPWLAGRIGAAVRKLHALGVPTRRTHSISRELEILATVLTSVADRPGWSRRIGALLVRCADVARRVSSRSAPIHRDFYADQVLVEGSRVWLIDFDLYCHGPEGVDVGNFVGHMLEQAVRVPVHASRLHDAVAALEQDVLDHEGAVALADVRALAALTLARHAYLSTIVPGREACAEAVLDAALARAEEVARRAA